MFYAILKIDYPDNMSYSDKVDAVINMVMQVFPEYNEHDLIHDYKVAFINGRAYVPINIIWNNVTIH